MNRLLVLAVTALVAIGLYATTAGGGQQAVTPGQFNALKKKVNKIRSDLDTTAGFLITCVAGTAVPITQYTDYAAIDDTGALFRTTGLDLTGSGDTPLGYALVVNADPNCVNTINSTLSLQRLSRLAPTFKPAARLHFTQATHNR